ncbi:MAG TPA: MBL fold metallo-hydrolase, partial [Gaiellales bacterium]
MQELGGGVHRVTQPLPWALDHVHCYAVDDADGWTLIDCGLGTAGTGRRWEQALTLLGDPHVRRIVITHYHPDHIGASTRLAELTGAQEIVQGRIDRALTERTWIDPESGPRFARFLIANGMAPADAERSAGEEDELPLAPVEPTRLVDEGDVLELAGEPFEVLVLPGHADGHIALLGRHSGRLFGGDVLLNEITPNVGRWDDNEPDPLGRYLHTLVRIRELAPSVVYPGHRSVVETPAARALEIAMHHAERLDAHEAALRDGARTAFDVAQIVWGGRLGFHEQRFAVAEALAHIE